MNSNFQLKHSESNNDLHIKLNGVFDGASAWDLVNTIRELHIDSNNIVINTNQLTEIFPFGKLLLAGNLPHYLRRDKIFFQGSQADRLMPDGCTLIKEKNSDKQHKCSGKCKGCKCKNKA